MECLTLVGDLIRSGPAYIEVDFRLLFLTLLSLADNGDSVLCFFPFRTGVFSTGVFFAGVDSTDAVSDCLLDPDGS